VIIYEKGECNHCRKISFPLYEAIKEGKIIGRLCESCSMKLSEIKINKEMHLV